MLKELSIQIQPDRAPELNVEEVRAAFAQMASLVQNHHFNTGFDKTRYFNFTFVTEDLLGLWSMIQTKIYRNRSFAEPMAKASIAVCEGPNGWDDYLQLFHFDPNLQCD
jgi:hypothetical protein